MKVYLGPYISYIGPYQIAHSLERFGVLERDRERIADWLSTTWVKGLCEWIHSKRKRVEYVKIEDRDAWDGYTNLAMIILPLLKKLKQTKQGAPQVDDEDVPEELRSTSAPPLVNDWDTDQNWFKRWEWVLNEEIWAFEQLLSDWEEQYWIVKPEIDFEEYPEDEGKTSIPLRWKVKGECDYEGRKAHQARIDRGLVLFGKYFQNLWD